MASEIEPDYDDPDWRNVRVNALSLDCLEGLHGDCWFSPSCQCACHTDCEHGKDKTNE